MTYKKITFGIYWTPKTIVLICFIALLSNSVIQYYYSVYYVLCFPYCTVKFYNLPWDATQKVDNKNKPHNTIVHHKAKDGDSLAASRLGNYFSLLFSYCLHMYSCTETWKQEEGKCDLVWIRKAFLPTPTFDFIKAVSVLPPKGQSTFIKCIYKTF